MTDNGLTVYLVDDDHAVLESLTGLLAAAQHKTRRFVSAEDFLDSLNDDTAGCLVTDFKMTGMTGLDLLRELKNAGSLLPIIVVTGHATVPVTVELMQSGAITLLQKPYNPRELLNEVDRSLELYARLRVQRVETTSIQARLETLAYEEYQVMQLMVDGLPNRLIAEELGISMRTVDRRRSAVLEKMQAQSATDIARMLTLLQERTQDDA
jgi:two-component system response regulator FixJ